MTENTQIYRLEIDPGESANRIIEINRELEVNKTRIAVLQAQQKAGIKLNKEQQIELLSLTKANQVLNREQKNLIDVVTSSNDSINQQRAQLRELTRQYDALSKEQQDNINIGGKLKAQINQLNESVSKGEQGTGRFSRNVGNYTQAIREALAGTGRFGQAINGLSQLKAGGVIGIIVTAVTALISVMSKAQPVVDFLAEKMSGLSNVVSVIVDRMGRLFTAAQFLINGEFSKAAQAASSAFDNLGEAISKANQFGIAYAKTMKIIEDNSETLSIKEARYGSIIAQLNAKLRDRTLSERERIKIAKEIQRLEEETFKERDQLLRQQLNLEESALRKALLDKGIAEAANLNGEQLVKLAQDSQIEDAKWQKVKEQLIKVYQNEQASLALIEKTQTRLNQINEQASEIALKKTEAAEKAAEKERIAAELQAKLITELSRKELDESLKVLDAKFKEEEAAAKQSYASKLAFVQGNLEQERLVTEQYNQEAAERKAAQLQREIIELQDYATTVQGVDVMLAQKQAELSNLVADTKIKNLQEITKVQEAEAKKQEQEATRQAEAQKQIFAQLTNQIGADIAAAVDAIFEGQENASEKFLASILTTTLDAIEQALVAEQAAAIAATTFREISTKGLAGLLTAAGNIALIKGAFAVAKNVIKGALIPKFEGGGIIPKGHELSGFPTNGDNTLILAKPNEVILNEQQQAAIGGAQALAAAGVPGFANGGVVPASNVAAASASNSMAVVDAIRELAIFTNITDVMQAARNKTIVTQRRTL